MSPKTTSLMYSLFLAFLKNGCFKSSEAAGLWTKGGREQKMKGRGRNGGNGREGGKKGHGKEGWCEEEMLDVVNQ